MEKSKVFCMWIKKKRTIKENMDRLYDGQYTKDKSNHNCNQVFIASIKVYRWCKYCIKLQLWTLSGIANYKTSRREKGLLEIKK